MWIKLLNDNETATQLQSTFFLIEAFDCNGNSLRYYKLPKFSAENKSDILHMKTFGHGGLRICSNICHSSHKYTIILTNDSKRFQLQEYILDTNPEDPAIFQNW